MTQNFTDTAAFEHILQRRRAIRKFDDRPVDDAVIGDLIAQAQLAPSSGNTQPYKFICVRSPEMKARVGKLCNDQAAGRSAAALIVVVAGRSLGRETLAAFEKHLQTTGMFKPESRAYYLKQIKKFRTFLQVGAWPLWSLVALIIRLFNPALSLLGVGPTGMKQWASRSALYAAQTLMLAAAARDLDTCPMEGFKAGKLSKLLKLRGDAVIPIVIALGHAAPDARIEPRWRKPAEAALSWL